MPIVYRPVASSYVGDASRSLTRPTARNGAARAAVVLLVLASVGGVAAAVWLGWWDQTIAGAVSLVCLGLAVCAFFLAIGGLVVAVQRPTRRGTAVFALVASVPLVVWLAVAVTGQALAILQTG